MNNQFPELREILKAPNQANDINNFSEPHHRRLLNALQDKSGSGDIASLVRDVLRREDEKQGVSYTLVSRQSPFPKSEIWEKSNVTVMREEDEYYLLHARPWEPEWLEANQFPDKPLFREDIRRNYESVVGDPFLQLVKRNQYRSIGQRAAIQAVLTAPENSTLIINLPTGAGKSLCAQLPALLNSRNNHGVSVVVVPTTALAIDQERTLKSLINHPTAYYSDDSVDGKERREGIRTRIKAGTQSIIFTSPESLMESLAPSLYEAARVGMLRYFIIDEAHMVEQWGDDFRPAFQELPGLRKDLLRLSSFTTLLLTATLTQSCLDTLETLFGDLELVSAVQLRPEPAFWFARCDSEEIREQRLIEALYNLPRPLIIYATKVEDVRRWKRVINIAGFKRCDVMTGKSTTAQRLELIQKLQDQKIDIVVATSAFGLGIDQADVRAVIHVCIPETIDRFYQEVGRAGRDGKASLSLTLYTKADFGIAEGLNEKSTITVERGLQRWQSMFNKKVSLGDNRYRVPIDTPPSFDEQDIDMQGERNRGWNIRTLTLMNRAKLIELDFEEPPQQNHDEPEEVYQKAWDTYRNSRIIRINNEYHLIKQTWDDEIEPVRQQRKIWSDRNLELMKEALRAKRCISEIFSDAYSIPNQVRVSRACGGCSVCRAKGVEPFSGIMPQPGRVWKNPNLAIGEELERLLFGDEVMLIFYDFLEDKSKKRRINSVLKWFVEQGIRNMIIPTEFKEDLNKEVNRIPNAFIFYWETYQPIKMPEIPTLIFHPPGKRLSHNFLLTNKSQAPLIALLPIDVPDPNRSDRRFFDIFPGRQLKFEAFCVEVGI